MKFINYFLALFLSFSAAAITVDVEKVEYSDCGIGDNGVIKPFNSDICEKDKSMLLMYEHFPKSTNVALAITNLKYKDQIQEVFNKESELKVSSVVFEKMTESLLSIVFYLLFAAVSAQLVLGLFKGMKDGHILGKDWGHFKNGVRIFFGFLLLIPITEDVRLFQVIIVILFIASLGMVNFILSTVIYLNQVGGVEYVTSDDEFYLEEDIDPNLIPKANGAVSEIYASETAKNYIDMALCLNQTSISKIAEYSILNKQSPSIVAGNLGFITRPSAFNDGENTLIEVDDRKSSSTDISFGVFLDEKNDINKKLKPSLCGKITVNIPRMDYRFSEVKDFIETTAKQASLTGNIRSQWLSLESKLIEFLDEKGVTDKEKVRIMLSASYDFHMYLLSRVRGFDLLSSGEESSQKIREAFDVALEIAGGLKTFTCMSKPDAIEESNQTIKLINSGSYNKDNFENFNLSCANLNHGRGGGLVVSKKFGIFSSAENSEDEINSILLSAGEDIDNGYMKLMAITRDLDKKVKDSFYNSIETLNLQVPNVSQQMRQEGFASLGKFYAQMSKEFEDANAIKSVFVSNTPTVIKNFNTATFLANDARLSEDIPWDSLDIYVPDYLRRSDSVRVSSNTFDKDSYISKASSIEIMMSRVSEALSNLDPASNYVKRTAKGVGGVAIEISEFPAIMLDSLRNMINSIKELSNSDVFHFLGEGRFYGDANSYMLDFQSACLTGDYSDMGGEIEERCKKIKRHPVVQAAELGHSLIDNGAAVLTISLIVYSFVKTIDISAKSLAFTVGKAAVGGKKSKKKKEKEKETEEDKANEGSGSLDSADSQKTSGYIKRALLNGLAQGKLYVVKFFSGGLVTIGLFAMLLGMMLAYVIPLIPYIMFQFSYIGWIILCFQLVILGCLYSASLFVLSKRKESGSVSEKALVGLIINVTIRPTIVAIGFIISWVMFSSSMYAFNLLYMTLLAGQFSEIGGFSIMGGLTLFIMSFVLVFVQISIAKWLFQNTVSFPNVIMSRMGASNMNNKEEEARGSVEALVMMATVNTVRRAGGIINSKNSMDIKDDIKKRVSHLMKRKERAREDEEDYKRNKGQ